MCVCLFDLNNVGKLESVASRRYERCSSSSRQSQRTKRAMIARLLCCFATVVWPTLSINLISWYVYRITTRSYKACFFLLTQFRRMIKYTQLFSRCECVCVLFVWLFCEAFVQLQSQLPTSPTKTTWGGLGFKLAVWHWLVGWVFMRYDFLAKN